MIKIYDKASIESFKIEVSRDFVLDLKDDENIYVVSEDGDLLYGVKNNDTITLYNLDTDTELKVYYDPYEFLLDYPIINQYQDNQYQHIKAAN